MAYAYPLISQAEIISSMKDFLDIDIDEKAFKKPDSQQWQEIFSHIVEEVTGAPEDWNLQLPPQATEGLEFPELYIRSFALINLSAGLGKIMPSLGVMDFSAKDVYSPSPERLKKICSAVINFIKFKRMRVPVYEAVKADIEQDRERHDTLLRRNADMRQRINSIRAEKAEQEPQLAKIREEIDEKEMEMHELQKTKVQKMKEISDLKTKIAETQAAKDQVKCTLLKTKEESDRLSQKIVQSPDKVRAEQVNLQQQVDSLKDTLERKRLRLSELQKLRENYKRSGIDAEKGLQLLEAIQAHINKESEITNEIAEILDKIQDQSQQTRELNNKKSQLQQMLTLRQEKLSKLSMQHQSRMKVLHEQQELLKQQKEASILKQSSNSQRMSELLEYKSRVEEEMKKEKQVVEQRIEAIKDLYSQLIEHADKYHESIGTEWSEIREILKQ